MARFPHVPIDRAKFKAWLEHTKQANNLTSNAAFAAELGYDGHMVDNIIQRHYITSPALCAMKLRFGLELEDVAPDPEPEPVPAEPAPAEPEPEPAAEPAPSPAPAVDLTRIEDTLKYLMQAVNAMKDMSDSIQRGFRVQTYPRLDSALIAEAVKDGMEAFWRTKKDEIVRLMNGVIFAGTFEAGKRLTEMDRKAG